MKKTIITYQGGKTEKFVSWDFNGLIRKNIHKDQIRKIELRGNNDDKLECTKYEVYFQNTAEGISPFKPWPIKLVNEKLELSGIVGNQYIETEETELIEMILVETLLEEKELLPAV